MKITVDVDLTPGEARAFLGLPDVKPMQDALMAQMQERLETSFRAMAPEEMLRLWMPPAGQGFEQLQKMFLQMAGGKRK
ncbi:DUF6489 family protein [soil metagenome]